MKTQGLNMKARGVNVKTQGADMKMQGEKLVDRFITNSKSVQNENFILSKDEFVEKLKSENFQFIYLHAPFKTFNKECEIDKSGINKAIVMADFAIAETGTFVVNSVDEKIRLATSLSEHLFLVVKKSNIVSSLEDIANYMNSECSKENSYIAFISGASRTADIERVLTIGVHGPVALTAIIVSDL